jgi:uncharacterized RDD family membrane protein YckC
MKCPKCQYISFETSERCRNCGYEFSLAVDAAGFDLPIQTGEEAIGPLSDFTLEPRDKGAAAGPGPGRATPLADFESTPPARPITSSFDLPLFKERKRESDAALVTPPAVPRSPLAVRRSTPTPRGSHRETDEPVLDLGAPAPVAPRRGASKFESAAAANQDAGNAGADSTVAPVGPRLLAAVLDGLILGSIGVIVLYLTLKVCGLQFAAAAAIPPLPFAAFLLLIAGGYLTLFTAAGGQTIGKMAAGIRVVPTDIGQLRVPLGHSVVRAAAYLASALPAGLGFLPALLGDDRRAIHDRLADTRVVKA